MTQRMHAAMAAISAHTFARDVDDGGDPVGIGAWHMLYSLADLAEERGTSLEELAKAATEARGFERRLYLVCVEEASGPMTVSAPVQKTEFEILAASLHLACGLASKEVRMHPDVEVRTSHDPYSREYVAPDHSRYAAYGAIGAGDTDFSNAARRATEIGLAPELSFTDLHTEAATGAEAARIAIRAFAEACRMETADEGILAERLLAGVMDVCERAGEDFAYMTKDCIEQREDILGRSEKVSAGYY